MHILDEIRREFTIPHAYENWRVYREQLTELLLSCGEVKSIALFGIGPGNDIDLRRLHDMGARLTLIDADRESMEAGLRRCGLLYSPRVELVSCSLTGITTEDTARFFDRLYQRVVQAGRTLTEDAFMELSLQALAELRKKLPPSSAALRSMLPKARYDLTVSVGLHSQLWSLLSYSWLTLAGNVEEQILGHPMNREPFFDAVRDMDDELIPRINAAILSMGAQAVFGVEAEESMVEGAWQSIQDIRRRCPHRREYSLHWPFRPEEQKEYDMLFQIVENTEEGQP